MLAQKYIPSRLISSAERQEIPVLPPVKPSWLRLVFLLFAVVREFFHGLWFMCIQRGKLAEDARRARDFWQQAGAVWSKAGQLLSLRSDLLPADICRELASLQDVGAGVPFESIRHILEHELGLPLESVFEHFGERPFLATSVAQLHRAYLRPHKAWVVVKIQKPYVEQMFQQDMSLIRKLSWLLNALSVYPNMRWETLCKQLDDLMTKELDFRYEASSLRRLKKTLRKHGIYVPETFSQYSSRRILVMEFIHGALLTDVIALQQSEPARLHAWLEENHITPRRLARRLFESVYRQIFEENLFHGDMRPGNVVLLRHNRLAILDCRSVGSLEGELLTKYRLFLHALAHQRYSHAADVYFLAATSLPAVEMSRVKTKLTRIWRVWGMKIHIREFDYPDRSLGTMFDEMNALVFTYQFTIQWSLSKMARALANLDASLQYLDPAMNYPKYMRRYFAHADRRTAHTKFRQTLHKTPRSINASQTLSTQVSEYMLFQQNILRRQAQVLQGKTTE
ncbi:MAG: AarF/ABC1/UbiB kinase family protein, partial [bacterium]|nr:AarF/ABC1/UbiB kinase family protein [bacterium]